MADLSKYNFAPELEVQSRPYANTGVEIVFKYPSDIPRDLKELFKLSSEVGTAVTITYIKSNHMIHIRSLDADARVECLLFVLGQLEGDDGKPLYGATKPPVFPIWRWQCLSPRVKDGATVDDLRAIPELQYDKWTQPYSEPSADVKNVTELPLDLSPALATLLIATFIPARMQDFYRIRPESEPLVIDMGIPVKLPIAFMLTPDGRYRLTFTRSGPHSADEIRRQITDLAIPTLAAQTCFIFSLTKVDTVDDPIVDDALAPFYVVAVRLPTEQLSPVPRVEPEDDDEDEIPGDDGDDHTVNIKFLVTKYEFTPDDERGIHAAFEKIFNDHRLSLCRKCNLLYNPVHERTCYRLFHTGKRIPFPETGEMEEIEVNPHGDEPRTLYNWDCCGIRGEDDLPTKCGKEPIGEHEEDPSGATSAFSFEKKTVGDPEFR